MHSTCSAPTFFVIATQNPIEHHGTYELPEAQLDRFALKLSIGYPSASHELAMLESAIGHCCDDGHAEEEALMEANCTACRSRSFARLSLKACGDTWSRSPPSRAMILKSSWA